ncbi:MAG: nucleotidyltransferase family protein [Xanthobacteraceae bacterium]
MNRLVQFEQTRRLIEIGSHECSKVRLDEILASANERLVPMVGRSELLRAVENELVATLRARGVDPIVVKGTSFADRLYADAALRPFSDIDVLVPEAALRDVRHAMAASGLKPAAQNTEKHEGQYAEEKWTHPTLEGLLIELHWDLVSSPKVRKAVSLTYEDLLPLIGSDGRQSAVALLLVAAIHGTAGHGFELFQHVIDVAQAARGMAGTIDAHELVSAAKGKGQRLAVEAALLSAALILSDEDCAALARKIEARPSAWWLSRMLGAATVVESRGARHSRYSWRRQLYREALVALALRS